MAQEKYGKHNSPVLDKDIYSDMYETLFGLQDDFAQYREKIDEALMLITIMEQRQADFIKKYGAKPPVTADAGSRLKFSNEEAAILNEYSGGVSSAISREMPTIKQYPPVGEPVRRQSSPTTQRLPQQQSAPQVQSRKASEISSGKHAAPQKTKESTGRHVIQTEAQTEANRRCETKSAEASSGKHSPRHEVSSQGKSSSKAKKKDEDKAKARAKDAIFYLLLVAIVCMVLAFNLFSGSGVRSVMGHSAFIVKSSSMEDVYPKGSLILTRRTEPGELKIGEDITFFSNSTTTITHRIVGIHEDYEQSGQRAFETKGTMNQNPDKDVVMEINVIGKVVFCSAIIGAIILFVSQNWPLLLFFAAVIIAMSIVLKKILKS